MSQPSDKVFGVKQLPLFPLPLVLMPNEVLPLHIFEPRYRQMLKDIEGRNKLFGITLLEQEDNAPERPALGTVGCAAEVKETNLLPDGRSNILVGGLVRYRLLEYVDLGDPYLLGEVTFFQDDIEDPEEIRTLADGVYDLFDRIAKAAFKLSGGRGTSPEIPKADPEALSFLVTAAFNLDNAVKYQMIETTSTRERLTKLRDILLQAVGKMEDDAETVKAAQTNGHADKKLDL